MAHAAHPSTWEAEEDHRKFEARLGYTVRFLKLRKVNKSTIGKQLLSFFFPRFLFVCLLFFVLDLFLGSGEVVQWLRAEIFQRTRVQFPGPHVCVCMSLCMRVQRPLEARGFGSPGAGVMEL